MSNNNEFFDEEFAEMRTAAPPTPPRAMRRPDTSDPAPGHPVPPPLEQQVGGCCAWCPWPAKKPAAATISDQDQQDEAPQPPGHLREAELPRQLSREELTSLRAHVVTLQGRFPDVERAVLVMILEDCGGDLEKTIGALRTMGCQEAMWSNGDAGGGGGGGGGSPGPASAAAAAPPPPPFRYSEAEQVRIAMSRSMEEAGGGGGGAGAVEMVRRGNDDDDGGGGAAAMPPRAQPPSPLAVT